MQLLLSAVPRAPRLLAVPGNRQGGRGGPTPQLAQVGAKFGTVGAGTIACLGPVPHGEAALGGGTEYPTSLCGCPRA